MFPPITMNEEIGNNKVIQITIKIQQLPWRIIYRIAIKHHIKDMQNIISASNPRLRVPEVGLFVFIECIQNTINKIIFKT